MVPIFRSREDTFKTYLEPLMKDFIFTEVSAEFLNSADLGFMENVPIPVKSDNLKAFIDTGLSTTQIADNIAIVIGTDTHFKYIEKYLQYLHKLFDDKLIFVFINKGEEWLEKGNYKLGLAYLRAAMMFKDDAVESMFCYANGCRYWYLSMEDEEGNEDLILMLKKESQTYFEIITSAYPEFPQAWYFLGYSYLNQGQYQKAQLCWRHYMECGKGDDPENIKEIENRLADLEDPVKIEKGVSLLACGRMEEGLRILESYVDTEYGKWWPLHFNLACAYRELGHVNEAIEGFLKVLSISPSHYDSMVALSELYAQVGDAEKAEKYLNKSKLVKE